MLQLSLKHYAAKLEGSMHPDTNAAIWFAQKTFSAKQRIGIYEKLSDFEDNGLKLQDGVASLKERAEKRGKTSARAIILHHVLRDLGEGVTLADSLSEFIPATETMVIDAGEGAGNLGEALKTCIQIIEAGQEMRSAFASAIAYPVLLTIVFCVAFYLVGTKAMPNLFLSINPEDLTGLSRWLYLMSLLVQSNWLFVIFGSFVFFVVGIILSMPRWTGRVRVFFDRRIPPWTIYRLVTGSAWLMSLSALVGAGVGVLPSLKQLNESVVGKNKWLSERMEACIFAIPKGLSLGEALSLGGYEFPDPEIVDDLVVYDTLSHFDRVLTKMGLKQIQYVLKQVKFQASILFWGLVLFYSSLGIMMLVGAIGIMGHLTGVSII